MKKIGIELYKSYIDNNWDRLDLFRKVSEKYTINTALYPGSYIHITPSFIIPKVTYVDNDRKAKKFFELEEVYQYIRETKMYDTESCVQYYPVDYTTQFEPTDGSYDLLISLYAGFISQACKSYLKEGGLLLVNNSHGDAGMANLDDDYQLVAVANQRNDKWSISTKGLADYFILKKPIHIDKSYLQLHGRGLGYKKTANVYIFEKKN